MVMLTGDNEQTARSAAETVDIDDYRAALLPEEKQDAIRSFQDEGHVVAMVGDGINDAPSLATADVGIAMGAAGTDTAIETADMALMADDLTRIPYAVTLSKGDPVEHLRERRRRRDDGRPAAGRRLRGLRPHGGRHARSHRKRATGHPQRDAAAAVLLTTTTAITDPIMTQSTHETDRTNWTVDYTDIEPIRLRDPVAEALAVLEPGDPFVVTYRDVVK